MSKRTLLDIVQEILSSMDSDEVNSITDTTESLQVAYVVRRVYEDIISRANLPEQYTLFELIPMSGKPVVMTLPETIRDLGWVKYDKRENETDDPFWDPVQFMPLEQFISRSLALAGLSDVENITITNSLGTFDFYHYTDRQPQWYTTFDDRTIIFDGYLKSLGLNLSKSKTLCYGEKSASFSIIDSFIPDLDEQQFPMLINEAKALAFAELKQTQHAKAEASARKGWINLQHTKRAVGKQSALSYLPGYGRK